MRSPVPNSFYLVLRVASEFILNAVDKWPRFLKIFFSKNIKVGPDDEVNIFDLMVFLILGQLIDDSSVKKEQWKRGTIWRFSLSCVKVVLILLTKLVVIYVWFPIVYDKISISEQAFMSFLEWQLFGASADFYKFLWLISGVINYRSNKWNLN